MHLTTTPFYSVIFGDDGKSQKNKRGKRKSNYLDNAPLGYSKKKEKRISRKDIVKAAGIGEVEIVLTSYTLFTKYVLNKDDDSVNAGFCYKDGLQGIDWSCIIFDEAHCLKSKTAQVCRAAKTMKTKVKIAMTGTPMQNNLDELWHFCDNLGIDNFGDHKTFKNYYKQPITTGRQRTASAIALGRANERQRELTATMNRVMLRRTKEEELKDLLMEKHEYVVFCPMSLLQRRCYERVLASPDYQLLLRKDEPCDCGRTDTTRGKCCHGGGGGGEEEGEEDIRGNKKKLNLKINNSSSASKEKKKKKKKKIKRRRGGVLWKFMHSDGNEFDKSSSCLTLLCLPKLMQVCNHLELVKPNHKSTNIERDRAFAEMTFGDDIDTVGGVEPETKFLKLHDTQNCGKMATLNLLLTKWITKQRKKILLFSNFTRTLDILGHVLDGMGHQYLRLDGSTPKEQRLKMCDNFNTNLSLNVFLISTKAGGMGLNLTGAQIVVIFDPSWNPAHDLQAQDRAFRIGQENNVDVYRLVSRGCIEEQKYMRSFHKHQMNQAALEGVRGKKRYFQGVEGDKKQKGDLYGIQNLLKLKPDGIGFMDKIRADMGERTASSGNTKVDQLIMKAPQIKGKSTKEKKKTNKKPKNKKSNGEENQNLEEDEENWMEGFEDSDEDDDDDDNNNNDDDNEDSNNKTSSSSSSSSSSSKRKTEIAGAQRIDAMEKASAKELDEDEKADLAFQKHKREQMKKEAPNAFGSQSSQGSIKNNNNQDDDDEEDEDNALNLSLSSESSYSKSRTSSIIPSVDLEKDEEQYGKKNKNTFDSDDEDDNEEEEELPIHSMSMQLCNGDDNSDNEDTDDDYNDSSALQKEKEKYQKIQFQKDSDAVVQATKTNTTTTKKSAATSSTSSSSSTSTTHSIKNSTTNASGSGFSSALSSAASSSSSMSLKNVKEKSNRLARKRRAKKGIQIQQVQQPMKKMMTEKNQVGTSSSSSSSSPLNAIHQSEEMKENTAKLLKEKGIREALEKVGNQRLQKQLQIHKNEFQQKSNNK